jgi:hypothetical protein
MTSVAAHAQAGRRSALLDLASHSRPPSGYIPRPSPFVTATVMFN